MLKAIFTPELLSETGSETGLKRELLSKDYFKPELYSLGSASCLTQGSKNMGNDEEKDANGQEYLWHNVNG